MKRASFAAAVSLILPIVLAHGVPLLAQEPARLAGKIMPRISAAGAFDARNNGRGDPEMYLGLATLEWPTNVMGLAVRVDGIYARRDRIVRGARPCFDTLDCVDPDGYPFFSSKVTGAGAMLGATYDLRARGAFRPYVLASGGVVQTHDKFVSGTIPNFRCITDGCLIALPAGPVTIRNDRPVSAAAHVGAGAVYSLQWISVFAEARYMAVNYANARGLNGAVPVLLGVRF